jgi:copper chaperone
MIELDVKNMTCGHCVRAVSDAVNAIDPTAMVQVELASGRVLVDGQQSPAELIGALQAAGYPSSVAGASSSEAVVPKKSRCCCG